MGGWKRGSHTASTVHALLEADGPCFGPGVVSRDRRLSDRIFYFPSLPFPIDMVGFLYLVSAACWGAALAGKCSSYKPCTGLWARVSPAKGAVVVDNSAKPYPGSHATVQAGVDALSKTSTSPQSLFVFPGTYVEQVYIPRLASNLTVQGYTCDSRGYAENKATITFNLALINTTSDDLTATLRQWNPNTKVYNLNVVNTFGHIPQNGQNLAVSAEATNQGYYGCQLIGYQDTLLAEKGKKSLI